MILGLLGTEALSDERFTNIRREVFLPISQ